MEKSKKIVCPHCGSENIADIVYGEVVFDDELEEALKKGEIFLGGCCIYPDSPALHCNDCGKEFGKYDTKYKPKYIPQEAVWDIIANFEIYTLRGLIALTYADKHACRMCGDVEWFRSSKESLFVHVFKPNSGIYGKPQLRLPGYKNKLILKDIDQPNGPCDAYLILSDPEIPDETLITAYAAYPAASNLREQLAKGVNKLPFLVAGAALSIVKEKRKVLFADKSIDISLGSMLKKSKGFNDVYSYYANILEVEEVTYGHTPMTRLTIKPYSNLTMYLYVSKSIKENHKFKVGDWISGEMALYATKEYANG